MEIWRDIDNWNEYQISNSGYVRSKNYNHTGESKLLKIFTNIGGYSVCNLMANGIRKRMLVHRLVSLSFIENPMGYSQINHKDGDKSNNRVDNLEWCTARHNKIHAISTGLIGVKRRKNDLSEQEKIAVVHLLSKEINMKIIADAFNISQNGLKLIKDEHSNTSGGKIYRRNRKAA